MRESYIRASVYDVEWQCLRVHLLAKNNDWGGFGTEWGCITNFQHLRKYALATTNLYERYLRYYRITNLLSATLFGYGKRKQFETCYKMVTIELEAYQSAMTSTTSMQARQQMMQEETWDWDKTKADLQKLYDSGEIEWEWIWDNLQERVRISNKKPSKMLHRPELVRFIALMREIDNDL